MCLPPEEGIKTSDVNALVRTIWVPHLRGEAKLWRVVGVVLGKGEGPLEEAAVAAAQHPAQLIRMFMCTDVGEQSL
jgi:hypothetical protein